MLPLLLIWGTNHMHFRFKFLPNRAVVICCVFYFQIEQQSSSVFFKSCSDRLLCLLANHAVVVFCVFCFSVFYRERSAVDRPPPPQFRFRGRPLRPQDFRHIDLPASALGFVLRLLDLDSDYYFEHHLNLIN